MNFLISVFFTVSSLSFAVTSKCLEKAHELADRLDDVTQESYQGDRSSSMRVISRQKVKEGFLEQVEIAWFHENEDGESWANIYTLKYVYNTLDKFSNCELKSYRFKRGVN